MTSRQPITAMIDANRFQNGPIARSMQIMYTGWLKRVITSRTM